MNKDYKDKSIASIDQDALDYYNQQVGLYSKPNELDDCIVEYLLPYSKYYFMLIYFFL